MIQIIILILFLDPSYGLDDIHSSVRNFSLELIDSTGFDNVAIAPFTVWSFMAAAGLWIYSESQEQVLKSLHLPQDDIVFLNEYSKLRRRIFDERSNGVNISSGIFIYTRRNWKISPAIKEAMAEYFGAVMETIDFQNPKKAAREADDLITDNVGNIFNIFRPDDFVNKRMIITSVISFDGYWKSEFDASHTVTESHSFDNDNNIYLVQMMHKMLKLPYSKMDSLNANVMELALGQDGKFCLLLIIPYPGTDIRVVYNKLYEITLKYIFDKLQSDVSEFGIREINLKLPKARIETGIVLNKPLSDIGASDVLDSEGSIFPKIAEGLYSASIDHTCEIVIKESGVFALASTPGYRDYNIIPKIEAEQPFIFFVMEKPSQTVMFGGLYSKTHYILKT